MSKVFISGEFLDAENAKVSVFDRGFLYGDGVFETMRSYNGNVFKLREHVRRLLSASKKVKIKLSYSSLYIARTVKKLLEVNDLADAYVKVIVSRGTGPLGIGISNKYTPSVIMFAENFAPIDEKIYKKGVKVRISQLNRNERSVVTSIKSLNYLESILARHVRERDANAITC